MVTSGPSRRRSAALSLVHGADHGPLEIGGRRQTQLQGPARNLPDGWSLELRLITASRPLAAEWRDLMERAVEPNVFASPEIMIAAAQHLPSAAPPLALFIRSQRRLVAVVAVRARSWGIMPRASALFSTPFHPVGVPLVDRHSLEPVMRTLTRWMRQPSGFGTGPFYGSSAIPGLLLNRIPLQGPFFRALSDLAAGGELGIEVLAPYSRPVLRADGADAAPPVSPRHRQNLRRLRRRLDEDGHLVIEEATAGPALNDALETLMMLEALGWKGREGTALAQNARTACFVRSAVRQLAPEGDVCVFTLLSAGQAVAAALIVGHLGRHYCFKIAYDPEFSRFSPGILLAQAVGERLRLKPGFICADSAADDEMSFMSRLWPDRLDVADVILRPAGPGGVKTRAMMARHHISCSLRATAKGIYHRLLRA